MNEQLVDDYISKNAIYFNPNKIESIRAELGNLNIERLYLVRTINFKDPSKVFILSIFFGVFATDRFVIGDTSRGVLKLLPVIISIFIAYFGFIWLVASHENEPVMDQVLKLVHILKYFWIISFVWAVVDWFIIKNLTRGSNYKKICNFFNN